ncbi:MAG: hypothetical protein ABIR03_01865 [Ginsengibacter sp.]
MKKIMFISAFMAASAIAFSQMQTVQLNSKKMVFNDGGDLPAAKAFIITTDVRKTTGMIKMQIFDGTNFKNKPLNESDWKRNPDVNSSVAILPNHYKLRGGRDYTFRFLYYRELKENERSQIREMLNETVRIFVKTNIRQKEDRYKFLSNPSDIYNSLNGILKEGMVNYETKAGTRITSFSTIVENILRVMVKTKLVTDSTGTVKNDALQLLTGQLENEIEMVANSYQYVLDDEAALKNYPVEKTINTLALNVGYAGIYNNGNFDNLDYFSGPYAGVSFPLGKRAFSGRFWNNTSISAGIFLQDFKVSDSVKISGPIIEKPIYAALGYRVFDFLKFHAGAAILEEKNSGANGGSSVMVKPFIGLSIELNLWLGIGEK